MENFPLGIKNHEGKFYPPGIPTISPYKKIAADFAEKSAGLHNQNRFAVLVRARD
jgi:hypothetical protein